MKKILLCLAALVICLTGCDKVDPVVFDSYKILNHSSTDITIKSYSINSSVTGAIETVIPILEVRPVEGYQLTTPSPRSLDGDYCTISNGERIVTQRFDDNDDLYMESSYTLIREDVRGTKTFLYIITDDFFADGEPITPAEPQ